VELTGREFEDALSYVARSWLPAKALVEGAVKGRGGVDPSGRIIKLPQVRYFCGPVGWLVGWLSGWGFFGLVGEWMGWGGVGVVGSPCPYCSSRQQSNTPTVAPPNAPHPSLAATPITRSTPQQGGVPWKQHLYALERELGIGADASILFVLYEDEREKKWRIQAVSVGPGRWVGRCGGVLVRVGEGACRLCASTCLEPPLPLPQKSPSQTMSPFKHTHPSTPLSRQPKPTSFENRKSIGTAAWRGLRDDQLSEASGVPGCVFVHASGFIGGNATYEGALQMAKLSIAAPDE